MAYFSNGTEGEMYEAQWCNHCIHNPVEGDGCAVLCAHLLYNYYALNKENEMAKQILDLLIPMKAGGIYADQCSMFLPQEEPAK